MNRAPSKPFEPRRSADLLRELLARAHVWLPEWRPRDEAADFARALLQLAARIEAEVTQRLDLEPQKAFRGFLDWIGVRAGPARAARLPIVFDMRADPSADAVLAVPPVQLQALGVDPAIPFEMEDELLIVRGHVASLVGADPRQDAYFLPPQGFLALEAPSSLPNVWTTKSLVASGTTQLQLDPDLGLAAGIVLRDRASGQLYSIVSVDKGIVTIDRPFGGASTGLVTFERIDDFAPFDPSARNVQAHELYIGSDSALNVETPAVIELTNGVTFPDDVDWQYWGKTKTSPADGWQKLTRQPDPSHLYLLKPAGAVEKKDIFGRQSRWLRATRKPGFSGLGRLSGMRLLVNGKPGCDNQAFWPWELQLTPPSPQDAVKLEGIANTAPLVLNTPFYPLGREPRLFDAFYIGSKEAFSKPKATVTLAFTMGNAVGSPAAAITFGAENLIVAAGLDGKLRRVRQAETGAPPEPTLVALAATTPPGVSGPVALWATARPGAASLNARAYVSVAAGAEVWLGAQDAIDHDMTWASLGAPQRTGVGPSPTNDSVVRTILARMNANAGLRAYAASFGELYQRVATANGPWSRIDVAGGGAPVAVAAVVPIVRHDAQPGEVYENDGLVCVSVQGDVYLRDNTLQWRRIALGATLLDWATYPLVVCDGNGNLLCFAQEKATSHATPQLIAFDLTAQPPIVHRQAASLAGHGFDFVARNGSIVAVLLVNVDRVRRPARWAPFDDDIFILGEPPVGNVLVEAPLVLHDRTGTSDSYHVFPGTNGDWYVIPFAADGYAVEAHAPVTDAAIFSSTTDWSHETDLWLDLTPSVPMVKTIVQVAAAVTLPPSEQAFRLDHPVDPREAPIAAVVYHGLHANLRPGARAGEKKLKLEDGDDDAVDGGLLYVQWDGKTRIYTIDTVDKRPGDRSRVANVTRTIPQDVTAVEYKSVERKDDLTITLRPAVDIAGVTAAVSARLTANASLAQLAGLVPQQQTVLHALPAQKLVILAAPWQTVPAAPYQYPLVIDAASGTWGSLLLPRPQNPALSWEYWNGSSWWQIGNVSDATANLLVDGSVTFCVPADLKPTDVVGRSNQWIRARLIGGDYGHEIVTIRPVSPGSTTQVVDRDTSGIHAPYVLALSATYMLCCAVVPDFVLANDNGILRDQTDANRTDGAVVEHFVPLATMLSSYPSAASQAGSPAPAPAECVDCGSGEPWSPDASNGASNVPLPDAGSRALYLGIDAPLRGGPIGILFLISEAATQDPYPLRVDALLESGFAPVPADDGTRGLSETGVLSLTLNDPPTQADLFGDARYWLRLRPREDFAGDWQPHIRGAYLNAAFARAAQTQTLELLGSSDGAPKQRITLARPPVIAATLVLRVRERLGAEEIAQLRAADIDAVLDKVGNRPGPWVRWTEGNDTDDAGPGERVYSLDDETGDIGFGDGLHGRVPPAGRDCFLAERYQTGGGAAANNVKAWSVLSLVTPLPGVERVAAPDGAAGGSDVQDIDTAIRFAPANASTRDRALTLHDLEVLARQFSRDVVQARALATGAGARVVVVMAGRDPTPSQATRRELVRYLALRASPQLAARGAIDVAPPTVIHLRVDLALTIDAIENTGSVSSEVTKRVIQLLDPGKGGLDGLGWPLGELPSEADIAATLCDVQHLLGTVDVTLSVVADDRSLGALPSALAPAQLAQLAPDGVGIRLSIDEEAPA